MPERPRWAAAKVAQLELFERYRSNAGIKMLRNMRKLLGPGLTELVWEHTASAQPYFLGENVMPLLADVPAYEMWPDVPVTPAGFVLLERPRVAGEYRMDAFSWSNGKAKVEVVQWCDMVRGASSTRSIGLVPVGRSYYTHGDLVEPHAPRTLAEAESRRLWGVIDGFFPFARQLIPGSGPDALERAFPRGKRDPDRVVYVELRARKPRATEPTEPRSVDWQHRWIVRGHWHNYYYATLGRTLPRYTAPYVKGPAGKPLVEKERLFGVVR